MAQALYDTSVQLEGNTVTFRDVCLKVSFIACMYADAPAVWMAVCFTRCAFSPYTARHLTRSCAGGGQPLLQHKRSDAMGL